MFKAMVFLFPQLPRLLETVNDGAEIPAGTLQEIYAGIMDIPIDTALEFETDIPEELLHRYPGVLNRYYDRQIGYSVVPGSVRLRRDLYSNHIAVTAKERAFPRNDNAADKDGGNFFGGIDLRASDV
jgi:hypothetical protein